MAHVSSAVVTAIFFGPLVASRPLGNVSVEAPATDLLAVRDSVVASQGTPGMFSSTTELPIAAERGIDPVLVTCDETNDASRKVIEANGGILEDLRGDKLRFWIPTTALT